MLTIKILFTINLFIQNTIYNSRRKKTIENGSSCVSRLHYDEASFLIIGGRVNH